MTKEPQVNNNVIDTSETIKDRETISLSDTAETGQDISPEISAFFSTQPVTIGAFFKILKEKRIKRFMPSDEEKAIQLMIVNDPHGDRLWSIATQNNYPSPIYYWLWNAIQSYIKLKSNGSIDPLEPDTNKILHDLISIVKEKNSSNEKNEKKAALNFLRLGITWLLEKRALSPSQAIEQARSFFFIELGESEKFARRLLRAGKNTDIKTAAAFWALANEAVASAEREARQERIHAADLREQIKSLNAETSNLKNVIEQLNSDLKNSSYQLNEITNKYNTDRQEWGHTLTDSKARNRVLMLERVTPLLQDALDALEIQPPEPRIALKRLKSALTAISEALQ